MKIRNTTIDLSTPHVMGILNVTPDSFSDGGKNSQVDIAVHNALTMVEQGATFIDIGGESTRPGASEVMIAEELDRVIPVIQEVRRQSDVYISIDTSKPEVMREAVESGADLINDVRALSLPGAIEEAAKLQVPVCLMHMKGKPRDMQNAPQYHNVVTEVSEYLSQRVRDCLDAGIHSEHISLDPGFGFGKSLEHNYELIAQLEKLHVLGYPLLVGMSRKSMIGQLLERETDQRLIGSVTLAAIAAQKGAQIIRVHDVQETVDAVRIVQKVLSLEK